MGVNEKFICFFGIAYEFSRIVGSKCESLGATISIEQCIIVISHTGVWPKIKISVTIFRQVD